jgi:WD40 repeat protein
MLVDSTSGAVIHDYQTMGPAGHRFCVEAAALSPDGKLFATGANGAVILWEVATGSRIRQLAGFSGEGADEIHGVAFAPDGRRIVACADDERARAIVWNAQSGKKIAALDAAWYPSYARSATFSRNGDQVVIGTDTGAILLWRLCPRQLRALLGVHRKEVCSLAASAKSDLIVSGSRNDKVSLWEIGCGTNVRDFGGHEFSAASVAFSSDGKWVAAGRMEGASLWDCASGKENVFISTAVKNNGVMSPSGYVTAIAFSPDATQVATGLANGSIAIWESRTGHLLRTLRRAD